MSVKIKVAIAINKKLQEQIFKEKLRKYLSSFAEVVGNEKEVLGQQALIELLRISEAEACITGWGTPRFERQVVENAPRLKIVCHAAGTVKPIISEAVWQKGIIVTSAKAANAIDVAETTLGLMIISIKRIWQYSRNTREGRWRDGVPVISGEMGGKTIGIIGAGYAGKHLIKLLKNFEVKILLYDPYVTGEEAEDLGVEKASLEQLMACSDIVSINAPSTPDTYHMINAGNLKLMKEGSILINTARGVLIDEEALIEELKERRIFACLDVTDPEPPLIDSPLRELPNVILTPHIAGSITDTLVRMGRLAVEELRRFASGRPLLYPVSKNLLTKTA